MFYRVRADIIFDVEDEARDFYHDCEIALPKGAIINPDQDNMEISQILLEECYHDESPTQPCKIIETQASNEPP